MPRLRMLRLAWDIWRAGHARPRDIARRQRTRLRHLVAFARARSPFYRQLYRDLPADVADVRVLPPVTRRQLMDSFDQVVTDPVVTWAGVQAFMENHGLIGQLYLGRFGVWKTSGVTAEPRTLVHDQDALAVYGTLSLVRGWLPWMTPQRLWAVLRRGDRVATVVGTGAHVVSAGMLQHQRQHRPWPFKQLCLFSIQLPLPELLCQLNAFQPAELISFPSALTVLAHEQLAGRLAIRPALIGSGGEWIAPDSRHLIESAFKCPVRENYGAAEFPRMVWGCRHGRLHVGADWIILEPVDEQYQPVPPGRPSDTTLVTNLANRAMPLIRYDIGDRTTVYPDACRCSSPFSTIQVEGRRDDTLVIPTSSGNIVRLLPMAISIAVHQTPGVRRFQVLQTEPAVLTLRLEIEPEVDASLVWETAVRRLREYLVAQSVPQVQIARSAEPPRTEQISGKLRSVSSQLQDPPAFA